MAAPLVVAGPNLTIDRTAALPRLTAGAVLRTGPVRVGPGGKGVNVVRAAGLLGVDAVLVGCTAGHTGAAVAAMLADESCRLVPVPIRGETRVTVVLRDGDGLVTVVNEPGPEFVDGDWDRYRAAVVGLLPEARWLVCAGSLPPAAPPDAYGRLVADAGEAGVPVLVDATGGQLAAAVRAGATVVTPNLAEASALLDGTGERAGHHEDVEVAADARPAALDAATRLVAAGARAAVVTAGRRGAAAAMEGDAWWCPAPVVADVNPIGAGDTFVAALTASWDATPAGLPAALVRAVATAAAGVEHAEAGRFVPARAQELAREGRVLTGGGG